MVVADHNYLIILKFADPNYKGNVCIEQLDDSS